MRNDMHDAHAFLKALAVVLGVAAVTTVIFQRVRQPVVLGYILAGLIVGPYVPIPLVADKDIIRTLSELGVILLMFSLGLEFSLQKLARVGATAGVTAIIQSSIMIWLGYMVGQAFGWTARESIFAGALIAISSTTIIAKAFDEQGIKGRLRELVVGVLIVEDLIAILLMAVLTALASADGLSMLTLGKSAGRLAAFLVALIVVGLLAVPPVMRAIIRLERKETTLVASMGLCFGIALLAQEFGYSVALGAFIAGSLVAESGQEKRVEHLINPVKDMFAAIFFVSVGMLIDPRVVLQHWDSVSVLTAVVIAGKLVGVSLGAFLTGNGIRTSVRAGMSLAQIGEFSFIIAGLGLSLQATRPFLYPVAVAVSAVTTLTTPWLIRAADPVAAFIHRKLPKPLQTFASLYGTWLDRLRAGPQQTTAASGVARQIKLLLLDAGLVAAVLIGATVARESVEALASSRLGLSPSSARIVVMALAVLLMTPFMLGVIRLARGIGVAIATAALPASEEGKVDLAAAPRRALVVALQLGIMLVVCLPILALTQPFLPRWAAMISVGVLLPAVAAVLWRSAADLQGHAKAGAELIVEALVAHARKGKAPPGDEVLEQVRRLMPGLGEPVPLCLDEHCAAVGKTLAELNLRGLTGTTVLAIVRGEQGVIFPLAGEVLRSGDVLALAGAREEVLAAAQVLKGASLSPRSPAARPR